MSYSVDFISLFGDVLGTIFSYCFIPVILKLTLFRKKAYSSKQIKIIAAINSFVIWSIFDILHICLETGETASVLPTVIYWFVNCWILGRKQKEKVVSPSEKISDSNDAEVLDESSLSIVEDTCSDTDVCVNTETISLKEEQNIQIKNYCSKCGNKISSDMSYCPYCGNNMDSKNDFNGLSEKEVLASKKKSKKGLTIILIVIIAIAVIAGIVVYCNYDNWQLQKIETELTTTTAIKDGDVEVLENLRAEYISYGGDVTTFDRLIQEDIENEFINAIDAKDSDKYKAYNEYLSKIGYTPDLISELICCTNLADTLQSAVRANNEALAVDCLSILIDAGITKEYYEILFNDALK